MGFQHPHCFQAVHRVPGEAGEGFGQDGVDLAPLAGGDHLIEVFPLFHAGPRKSLVSKDAGQLPVWILLDLLGVVGFLRLVAGDLLLAVGGYPAVGRYPLVLLFPRLRGVSIPLGGDDPHPPLYSLLHVLSFPGGRMGMPPPPYLLPIS